MHCLLQAMRLSRYFRGRGRAEVRAIDDVSLSIAAGSFVVLTGPSGSGKTTLLSLLGALDRPSSGQVLLEGRDFGDCSDAERARLRRRFGFVFQSYSLIDGLPVWENVTYPLVPLGAGRRERQARARDLLNALGLADVADALALELSGGEKQRVAVARALAVEPKIIFADEPTSNLDANAAANLLQLLRDQQRRGVTLVLSSHDPQAAVGADAIYSLRAGRLAVVPETCQ
ncbi:MAG: ABC transporter ATP-binding protein [Gemmataceae bacterium]|nr:ABC transporter ATP-binding protein [Gemmataceae bacterium]